jgi:hypothetical protein
MIPMETTMRRITVSMEKKRKIRWSHKMKKRKPHIANTVSTIMKSMKIHQLKIKKKILRNIQLTKFQKMKAHLKCKK